MASPTQQDVYGTSAWAVGNADLTRRFSAILSQYGIVPDQATLSQYGLGSMFDPAQSDQARANPNSIFSQLGHQRDVGYGQNQNTANAHNMLFSGAFKNSQDQVGRDYQSNVGQAGQNELSALLGLGGEQSGLYQSIYGNLLNQPVTPDASPTSVGGSEADRPYVNGAPDPNPWHINVGAGAFAPTAPKKPKPRGLTGITGGLGLGHVT